MSYLFTSESVSEGHPDKVADQISDALLDEFLRHDPESKVACETLVTTGLVVAAGEVRTKGYVNIDDVARKAIQKIGYTKAEYKFDADSCGVISTIHGQSDDIYRGVERGSKTEEEKKQQGAGDQGMMFGFASTEMDNYMPMPIEVAHILLQELAKIRKEGILMPYLRPDAKSQVTIEYDEKNHPVRIDTIVVSTQHDEFDANPDVMQAKIKADIESILIPRVINLLPGRIGKLFNAQYKLYVNPTGNFVIGGPHGDSGLTGRKIIVDTYGGRCAHGGGAFSGKDASKVDRSAAYATRYIAKNLVAAGVAEEALVQVAYAIGVAEPVGFLVNTNGSAKVKDSNGKILSDKEISNIAFKLFDLRPYSIIKKFGLQNPIFSPTCTYGHFGRDHYFADVEVYYNDSDTFEKTVRIDGNDVLKIFKKAEFFAWEKLDVVDAIKGAFGLGRRA
jgi:S-adenosylmethionine synthetase